MLRPLDPFQAKIQGIQSLPGGRIRTFSGKPEVGLKPGVLVQVVGKPEVYS
jgi:hypothetical protein